PNFVKRELFIFIIFSNATCLYVELIPIKFGFFLKVAQDAMYMYCIVVLVSSVQCT
uniref:Uncharacterized protein n=1 Tax=Amphimedon queenslandica TaxID=400682 RepID=A0A1X7SEG5_AMPQE